MARRFHSTHPVSRPVFLKMAYVARACTYCFVAGTASALSLRRTLRANDEVVRRAPSIPRRPRRGAEEESAHNVVGAVGT